MPFSIGLVVATAMVTVWLSSSVLPLSTAFGSQQLHPEHSHSLTHYVVSGHSRPLLVPDNYILTGVNTLSELDAVALLLLYVVAVVTFLFWQLRLLMM